MRESGFTLRVRAWSGFFFLPYGDKEGVDAGRTEHRMGKSVTTEKR